MILDNLFLVLAWVAGILAFLIVSACAQRLYSDWRANRRFRRRVDAIWRKR